MVVPVLRLSWLR